MLLNFRLVATGLAALAACAQALDMTNFTANEVDCGTPSLSVEQWTHSEEVLAQEKNTTKRQVAQPHRIPAYITVLAKNNTVNGGNIQESQIQQLLDEFNKFYSYGFELDTSVDKIHRYTRPDLFDPNSGMFTGTFNDIQRQYHRGEGDYASLNIIFLFRLRDWYKNDITTERGPNGETWTSWRRRSGGISGRGSIPVAGIWEASNAKELEISDGILVSSATIPNMAYPEHQGSLSTFSHEVGHWLGLEHTDHSRRKGSWGRTACDRVNDGIDDTPTHMIDANVARIMPGCPPQGQINTCQHLDSRPDLIYNLMTPKTYGCKMDGLTDGQKQRTLDVYEKFRMPYKGQLQQKGRWVQPQGQQSQEEGSQVEEPQEEEKPQEKKPQDQQPQDQQRLQLNQKKEQNEKNCLNEVDQEYKQREKWLTKSMPEKFNQLQAERDEMWEWLEQYRQQPQYSQWADEEWKRREEGFSGRKKEYEQKERGYWQDLKQDTQKGQKRCREEEQK
ncbi:metalloprotease 1 [Beauveria bassiana ARSEF 2860]|uniref:Metalloprotease 1 n=1 Tax=Beauveria bassiana (strain ARSEF 2860) TaxID=655819 RepID=J4UIE1_BEAB2|nr:metalloprotease 1 [Beauveria bassiana ARSEF 2860]EJP63247.1 metalloprotease 1 [Beauveria bassiana ARSEF 2860]